MKDSDKKIAELERELEHTSFLLRLEKERTTALRHTVETLRAGLEAVDRMLKLHLSSLQKRED